MFQISHCFLPPKVPNINFPSQQMKEEFVLLAYTWVNILPRFNEIPSASKGEMEHTGNYKINPMTNDCDLHREPAYLRYRFCISFY